MKNSKEIDKNTKKLYFEDQCQIEFEARVLEKKMFDNKPVLVLDQTCFYPESGGQPSDKGRIGGERVVEVFEEEGKIIHLLENPIEGDKVKGHIDWATRFDHMQQHTGQHILSQSFYELFEAKTLSFHIGNLVSTLEIDLRKLSEEEIEAVEKHSNAVVFQDREVKTYLLPEEKISKVPLRKHPQKEGTIRVVEVVDFDFSACGGTHCKRTGEVGLIKILKRDRIRNNVRLEFVTGLRALRDYSLKNRVLTQVSNKLTVGEEEVMDSIENLFSDLKSKKKKLKKLQQDITQFEASEIIKHNKGKVVKEVLANRTPEEAKLLAINIINKGEFVVLYGTEKEHRAHLVFACSESLGLDIRELVPLISPLIEGRGGGRSSLVELAGEKKENLEAALNKAHEFINKKLETGEKSGKGEKQDK